MASSSGAAVGRVVRTLIAPWLCERGFQCRGRFFNRPSADVIHVASVQASRWNSPQSADFYVNIDVEWPACHALWTGSATGYNPALAPCFARSRLRTPGGAESWNALQEGESLSGQIRLALSEHAETFWQHHSNLADVLRRLEAGESVRLGAPTWFVKAALLDHFGRRAEALATIDLAASRGRLTDFDYGGVRARIGDPG